MLGLAVQPPSQARPGVALYPPVVGRLTSETSIFEELSQTWAVATLLHHSGEVLHDQLGGKIADSAHPMPETAHGHGSNSSSSVSGNARDRAYFYFPDLIIHEPGRYRIRVSLMQMGYSYEAPDGIVSVREYVDSQSITVEDRATSHARPSE